jgi:hypothetical protein
MPLHERDFERAAEIEDLKAPHGRCAYCRSPFGMPNKDGMIFYRFDQSHICTGCQAFDDKESSRRYDMNVGDYTRRRL